MPKHEDEENSEHLASVESSVSSVQKTHIYFPHSKSTISVHRDDTLNIQFLFCKEVFRKLKHFCFGGCFHFCTKKEVLLHDAMIDIPHQCNKLTAMRNIELGDFQGTSPHV